MDIALDLVDAMLGAPGWQNIMQVFAAVWCDVILQSEEAPPLTTHSHGVPGMVIGILKDCFHSAGSLELAHTML